MKRFFALFLISAASITFSSCFLPGNKGEKTSGQDIELVSVSVQDDYSIGIPAFMTKTNALNGEASLQYQNMFKEAYVIVIDEDKEEFIDTYMEIASYDTTRSALENYADTQVQLTASNLNVINRTEFTSYKINGLGASSIEMDATVEGVEAPISYFLTFIEGDQNLYMVMAWTLQGRKDIHRSTFEKMVKSFKTLKETPLAGK